MSYVKVEPDEEELFATKEEAEASYNEDEETIYVVEEVEEKEGV